MVLEEVQLLYEPILQTLDTITSEKGWDHKTVDLANGLLKNITESTFLVALNVCSYTLGFTKQLSSMLQGTAMDVIEAYKQIELVKTQLNSLRGNCDEVFISDIWPKVKELAHIADIELVREEGERGGEGVPPRQDRGLPRTGQGVPPSRTGYAAGGNRMTRTRAVIRISQ